MSEISPNKTTKDDEIDLLDLFRRMGKSLTKGMNSLGRAFLISTVFLLRKCLWLTLSLLIGIGISLLVSSRSLKIYSSELTLRSNATPSGDMITFINRLHIFSRGVNKTNLAEALSLSPVEVWKIKDIQAFWAIDMLSDGIPDQVDYKNDFKSNDTIDKRMQDRFIVRARVSDPQEFSLIRDKIIEYIKQDPLFQQKNQVRLAQNKELQLRLTYDIKQLDSLQKVKYFEETRSKMRSSGGQIVFLQEQNTQLIYSDIYTLYTKKQAIDLDMDLYKDVVTLLSDFTIVTIPINDTLSYVKDIVPIFLISSLIILILLENRKKLRKVFDKY